MVTHENDQRVFIEPFVFEHREKATHQVVDIGHLTVVAPDAVRAILAPIGLRRIIGRVRIVKMDKGKEGLVGLLSDPLDCRL